ncbi:hypothetical protein AB8R05_01740 [Klebsiella variicola]|nr:MULTISPECIES: hypothetical protein [Klebsiella]EGF63047.1 conserved domain protein [Klebsiella sp. MS 92-3]EKX3067701.1 hypothetical protein [Klebsiella pneumoniae]EMB6003904.1 hypothetical protein [Klebsiella pneumoniae]KYL88433.1 hypothetical protein SQ54_22180 [Klebsiella pneumoniae]MBE3106277.1 hypothetical protein [Klebsiella pneumoniae]
MSATNSTAKESSNADLIAMLSELDGLSSIEEPDVLKEEVVEVKKSPTYTTDDLFSELLPLVSAEKPVRSEEEAIKELLSNIDDEIKPIEKPIEVVEAPAEAPVEAPAEVPVVEEQASETRSEPEKPKRSPSSTGARKKRFSMDQLSDEVMAELGFERKAFMDGYNTCPIKAMDKIQNVMAWSQGLAELSVYTQISVTHLINTGASDTAGFRLAMMSNPTKPYPSSTASAQAGQMMSILPVLGMAIKDGKTLTLNEDSPLVKKFKNEAM